MFCSALLNPVCGNLGKWLGEDVFLPSDGAGKHLVLGLRLAVIEVRLNNRKVALKQVRKLR